MLNLFVKMVNKPLGSPFDKFKEEHWTLEHIHAQRSESMNRQELWLEWLKLQLPSLKNIVNDNDGSGRNLIARIEACLQSETISRNDFEDLKDSEQYVTSSVYFVQLRIARILQ